MKPLVNLSTRGSFGSREVGAAQPVPFRMDKLVSVTLSRLSSPPTETLPFSTYGMKARHHPVSQAVFSNSISTSSSSSSSSSLSSVSSGASPSLSSSLDELDEAPTMNTCVPASPITLHSTSVPTPVPTTTVTTGTTVEEATETGSVPSLKTSSVSTVGSSITALTPPRSCPLSQSELGSESTLRLTSATQTIRLTRLPRVLRLHIKRFRWIGRQREKVGCHVSFPLILDLSEFMLNSTDQAECSQPHLFSPHLMDRITQVDSQISCSKSNCSTPVVDLATAPASPTSSSSSTSKCTRIDESQSGQTPRRFLYHLTGVIVHHGRGFQSGHYTAYCLNDQPECWLNCNDANVTLCDFNEVAAAQAYLLFYSELMPTSPYPLWYNGLSSSGDLKLSQSSLPRLRSTDECVASTSGSAAPVTSTELKANVCMKRSISTPSHTLHLRSTPARKSAGSQLQSYAIGNPSRAIGTATFDTVSGSHKPRSNSRRSVTPDSSL